MSARFIGGHRQLRACNGYPAVTHRRLFFTVRERHTVDGTGVSLTLTFKHHGVRDTPSAGTRRIQLSEIETDDTEMTLTTL